ncbi:MAG TPA: hypothetical protein DIU35_03005 [Candidatus Latescibacteria bacterium]|mgnify:CR=1 FL=1|nr:hypothetical protein [Gemmatimonadota bacterium]HCR16428.1 hypothetical protein [Candidatus Latescibacterota bacterium]|tara:strand:- start:10193 stop:10873 length:681 start_codon:yes stop_codon:yes gene_type:complete
MKKSVLTNVVRRKVELTNLQKLLFPGVGIIEIEGFVEDADLHPMLYDSPLLVGPDDPIAAKPYSLLREALSSSDKLGIGRIVMRDKEEVVAISPQDDGLVLFKLQNPVSLRKISDMSDERNEEVSKPELELAKTLVSIMSTTLGDLELTDRYHEAVKQMIQIKVEGKEVVAVADEEESIIDITAALKQSIEQAKSMRSPGTKKPAKKRAKKAKSTTKKPRKARKIA